MQTATVPKYQANPLHAALRNIATAARATEQHGHDDGTAEAMAIGDAHMMIQGMLDAARAEGARACGAAYSMRVEIV